MAKPLAGVLLGAHRRREREQREHLRALREREEKLRLALWASSEFYWQFDLERRELESIRIEPGRKDDLNLRIDLDADHQIHPDDLPLVLDRLPVRLRSAFEWFCLSAALVLTLYIAWYAVR